MRMSKLKVLILTDHSNHSSENSLYSLARTLFLHPLVSKVDIASRGLSKNHSFFSGEESEMIYTTSIDQHFYFSKDYHPLDECSTVSSASGYDFVWMRLPPPLDQGFLTYLAELFKNKIIINQPSGIYETGSKAFLMNFQELCPPMMICNTIEDILAFSQNFTCILKPLREYGGRGILKIENESVSNGQNLRPLLQFIREYEEKPTPYLAVKYLKNVNQGDKRIIVIDGQVMGASLRLPPPQSWMCNVAMGGTSHHTEVTEEEINIIHNVDRLLSSKGIVMYGIDTLVNDDNKRVLSEINTTSIGGLPQMAQLTEQPLVERGVDLIVQNVLKRM